MAHEEDNIDTSMVAVVGVIAAGLSFGLIFLLMVLYYTFDNSQKQIVLETPNEEAERVWAQQEGVLNEAAWVNQEIGQVRIPVSAAMNLVVAQLGESPEDAGVTPPQFAEADGTITENAIAPAAEESPAVSEEPASDSGSSTEEPPTTTEAAPEEE